MDNGGEYETKLIGGSLSYWFRLKEKRVEFLPELGYYTGLSSSEILPSKQQRFSFLFNVDVYLFDIINDCDCPTFSKQGTGFQRSFFIELSPGLDYQFLKMEDPTDLERDYDGSELAFRFGIGAGYDIGISDLITIAPIISINYATRPKWNGLSDVPNLTIPENGSGSEWILSLGVRMMFRPDYTRKYR